ncbi:pentatricopeptide repeat-containing protein At1g10910, chloroplastic isoform X1 [Beta vulgaris subsp. vulgaris]|uniref:pentatricopeptide repeat-containing protein At1g10910, chloroplastic isoform X1 n=2 Tax=Beta vulgaris subsp. vulgaris TaxID=3555 RepID=UPI0020367DE7|nr:pentatricopeptide repeat-containing protein At1g10910, chloroplastic isoform X1 [Beta vulgaris subsp. vulgaris]
MDIGAASINGCRNITANPANITTKLHSLCPPATFPITNSLPNNFGTLFATQCIPTKIVSATKTQSPRSVREDAIREIQHSSDVNFALARCGEILKVPDLNIILRNFGRSSRWKHLIQLFEWMQKHGKINIASYSSYIKFMGERKDISKALNVYETINDQTMRNNSSICNSVLSSLVKNNKFEKAMSMFEQMKQNGLLPDVVTYSTLLAGCLKVDHGYMKALELVEELENNGIQMDVITYGTLIAVCATNRRCEEAEMYFIRMQAEGHSANMYHYSSLLNAYASDGDHEKADKLVQNMTSAGYTPNKVFLTTLLKVYVRGTLFEKSRSLLLKLESLGFAEDEIPYCLLMDGLSKSGKVHEAKLTFDRMNERQVRSNGYSHSIMITAFCRAGHVEEAKKLARDYEASYNKYDVVILNVLLCAYCRAGDMDFVMQTLRKMDKLGINPDQYTFRILIKYFCKEKLYLLAYRTLQDMRIKGHQLEEEVLSSLLLQLGSVGAHSEAFSVYMILVSGEKAICKTLHEKILHILIAGKHLENAFVVVKDSARFISPPAAKKFLGAFMKSGNIDLLNDAVEAIHDSGHKIDQDVFHLAISRYTAQPEKMELLLQLLQWMPSHGYVVDLSTRNLILKHPNLRRHQVIAEIMAKQHAIAST